MKIIFKVMIVAICVLIMHTAYTVVNYRNTINESYATAVNNTNGIFNEKLISGNDIEAIEKKSRELKILSQKKPTIAQYQLYAFSQRLLEIKKGTDLMPTKHEKIDSWRVQKNNEHWQTISKLLLDELSQNNEQSVLFQSLYALNLYKSMSETKEYKEIASIVNKNMKGVASKVILWTSYYPQHYFV